MPITEMDPFLANNVEQRPLKKHICYLEKLKILNMWLGGKSCKAISRETGRSATTVCRWINRWKLEGHINRRSSPEQTPPYRPPNVLYKSTTDIHNDELIAIFLTFTNYYLQSVKRLQAQ